MGQQIRPFAIVTGASSGIGFELGRCAASAGFDLLLAADESSIHEAATQLANGGVSAQALQVDLATLEGVERLYAAAQGRPVTALLANAGHGLGGAFLDQDLTDVRHVIDTNVTGTVALLHMVGREMRARGEGRILVTGSIAGLMPGTFQAAYNGTKAFLDSFAAALRNELKDSGVSVTCLLPGATDTEFFARADMLDTKVGAGSKQTAEEVARLGWDAMMKGEGEVVSGMKNKMKAAMSGVLPSGVLAEQHRKEAEPGTARKA